MIELLLPQSDGSLIAIGTLEIDDEATMVVHVDLELARYML